MCDLGESDLYSPFTSKSLGFLITLLDNLFLISVHFGVVNNSSVVFPKSKMAQSTKKTLGLEYTPTINYKIYLTVWGKAQVTPKSFGNKFGFYS